MGENAYSPRSWQSVTSEQFDLDKCARCQTDRQELQTQLATAHSRSVLTPGQPVPGLINCARHQAR